MKRILTWGAVAAVVLFLAAYLGSPVLAVRALISAAEEGDATRLERLVDFPAFRDSLKDELNDKLIGEMRDRLSGEDSALGGLGMLLAPSLVSGAVDALVTPGAVATMVTTARAPGPETAVDAGPPEETRGDRVKRSYGYRSLDVFVVTLNDVERPDRRLKLLMERRGLFGWRLAGVELDGAT